MASIRRTVMGRRSPEPATVGCVHYAFATRSRETENRAMTIRLCPTSRLSTLLGLGLSVLGALVQPSCGGPPLQRFERTEPSMGTSFRIVAYASDPVRAESLIADAFERIAAIEHTLTDWNPDSELSRLSRQSDVGAPTARIPVSDDLFAVLWEARRLASRTSGAFDPTIGPFVRLWRRARRQGELPSLARIAEARRAVGWQHLALDPETSTVRLHAERMRLDLGGIAKGWALDEALAVLRRGGIDHALVDGGGDVAVRGAPPGRSQWRIALRPFGDEGPECFVSLTDAAVATSGDRYRFVEIDGERYSHLIDPQTGLGTTVPRAVSVIAPTGAEADALATALVVGGEELAGTLGEVPGIRVFLWTVENDGSLPCDEAELSRLIEGSQAADGTARLERPRPENRTGSPN